MEILPLKPGSLLLQSMYRIDMVIGSGGYGITYLATDTTLDKKVAIKEFFPKTFCKRDAATSQMLIGTDNNAELVGMLKKKFLKEARSIAKLNHPNIIKIIAAFEQNGTAYYVMDYVEGMSLQQIVKQSGPLPEAQALYYINQIGSALDYLHQRKMNHLDVKPANIMVRGADNNSILIDFGLSKQYDVQGQQTSDTPVGVSHGYAPNEQYKSGGVAEFSPPTDVYSLAATLYFLLTGIVPPKAQELIDERLAFPESFPKRLIPVINKAMSLRRVDRYSSVYDFLAALNSDEVTEITPADDATEITDVEVTEIVEAKVGESKPIVVKTEEIQAKTDKSKKSKVKAETKKQDDSTIACTPYVAPWWRWLYALLPLALTLYQNQFMPFDPIEKKLNFLIPLGGITVFLAIYYMTAKKKTYTSWWNFLMVVIALGLTLCPFYLIYNYSNQPRIHEGFYPSYITMLGLSFMMLHSVYYRYKPNDSARYRWAWILGLLPYVIILLLYVILREIDIVYYCQCILVVMTLVLLVVSNYHKKGEIPQTPKIFRINNVVISCLYLIFGISLTLFWESGLEIDPKYEFLLLLYVIGVLTCFGLMITRKSKSTTIVNIAALNDFIFWGLVYAIAVFNNEMIFK